MNINNYNYRYDKKSLVKYLKFVVRLSAVAGVIISLGNIKGWFIDKERQNVYKQLLHNYEVPIIEPGVQSCLDEFYFSKIIPQDMQSIPLKGLRLSWVRIGSKGPPLAGSVHALFENEKESTALCTLEELRDWANETPVYAWLGWWLLAFGVGSEILIDIFNYFAKKSRVNRW